MNGYGVRQYGIAPYGDPPPALGAIVAEEIRVVPQITADYVKIVQTINATTIRVAPVVTADSATIKQQITAESIKDFV
jgi:hypothetical protein